MKLLVIFGSKSDEYIYAPLIDAMGQNDYQIDFEIISAHRDPQRLTERLANLDYDIVVAGAGLAAHLPGVTAALTKKPVFGVSVPAQMGGLDAMASIQQMPYGIPVLAFAPEQIKNIPQYLNSYRKEISAGGEKFKQVDVLIDSKILSYEYVQKELKRLQEFAAEQKTTLNITHQYNAKNTTINMVHNSDDILELGENSAPIIHIPIMEPTMREKTSSAMTVFEWAQQAGGWCGVNNSRNALCFLARMIKEN